MAGRGARGRLRVLGVIIDVMTGIAVAVLLVCVVARYAFGMRAFAVLTASMTPTLEVGDLVVDVPSSYEDIKEGDVITYVLNSDLDVVTHRVIGKHDVDQSLVTKGDANESADGVPVDYRNVVGVVRAKVPRLGLVFRFLSTPAGKVVAISIVIAVAAALAIARTLLRLREDEVADDPDEYAPVSGQAAQDVPTDVDVDEVGEGPAGEAGHEDADDNTRLLGERRRNAIAAVIAAEFEGDADSVDDDWDDDEDEPDDEDEWNGDFSANDVIFGRDDEYDGGGGADGAGQA